MDVEGNEKWRDSRLRERLEGWECEENKKKGEAE